MTIAVRLAAVAVTILCICCGALLEAEGITPQSVGGGGAIFIATPTPEGCWAGVCHNVCDTNLILHNYSCVKGGCEDGGTVDCSATSEVCLPPIIPGDFNSACGGGGGPLE